MPPQSRNKGESKQGLVITLVFFILATIGLGVSTYYGFAAQEEKDKAVAQAKKDADVFKGERDWYKFQAMMYRSYMGQAQTLDGVDQLGTLKTQFDQGTMKVSSKDKEEVTKLLKDLDKDKRFGWNGNKPKDTYEDQLRKSADAYETVVKRDQALLKKQEDDKKALQKKDDEFKDAQAAYDGRLKELSAQAKKNEEDLQKQINNQRKTIDARADELEKARKAALQEKTTLTKDIGKKNDEIKHLLARVKDQEERIAAIEIKSTQAPQSMRTDWKIVRMDRRGHNPYINLGSTDNVKPQQTFTIHGIGLDGRPNRQAKGTLEVVHVLGAHLSQARVTAVKDADRDPILEGDIIYNPSWNPTLKKHVALAGIMDITGDGRDSLREFMRNLERQNVIVDAYLDPKDGSVKGQITFHTDYLILGESQEFSPTGRGKEPSEAQKRGQKEMEAQALKYGVKPIALHKYLEMTGYRLPRGTGEELSPLYKPSLRPDQTPRLGGEKPPAMKPDK